MLFRKEAIYCRPRTGKPTQAVYVYEDRCEKGKEIGIVSNFLSLPGIGPITNNNGISISYFKFGASVTYFTLSCGVSKGLNEEFLKLCVGMGVPRRVDLVLSGHGHKNVEFRLGFGTDFLFFKLTQPAICS